MAPSNTAATAAKKYKLFSSAATGEKAPCAFFASPQGCRNGANCKFSHEKTVGAAAAAPSPNGEGSVVSSESEDDNDKKVVAKTVVKEDKNSNKKKTKANKKKGAADENPFLAREEQQETAASTDEEAPPPPPPAAAAAVGQPSKSASSSSSKWVPLHRSSSAEIKKKNDDSKNESKSDNSDKKPNRRGKISSTAAAGESPFVNPKGGKKARGEEEVKKETKAETRTKEKAPAPPPQKTTHAATTESKKKQKSAPAPANNTTSTSTIAASSSTGIHQAFGSLNLPVAPFSTLPNIAADSKKKTAPKKKSKQQQEKQKEEEPLESGEEEEEEDTKPTTTKRQEQHDSDDSNNDDNDDGNTDNKNNNSDSSSKRSNPKMEKYLNGVWPESTAVGRKWLPAVRQTRQHFRYLRSYDFEKFQQQDEDIGSGGGPSAWIRARPYNKSNNNANNNLPAAIAIDCEMCETQDPVSKKRNPRALCRISIINAENDELLLDTLVKPAWPVINHRSWINGIAPQHLETVQFTLRHAQAFLMELCTDETIILGHAVHNDLSAMQMEHYCVVDSACLFQASDSERATVSLKDLAMNVLNKKMPETHDSVNDARVALRCLEHYMEKNGKVETIVRSNSNRNCNVGGDGFGSSTASFAMQLFVHRIPRKVEPDHLMKMFLAHSSIEPESVQDVDFPNPSTPMGKTIVTFRSQAHANLAFETLAGKSEADPSGRLQKKVFMKTGSYIRVRKMAYECQPQQQQQQESQQDSSPLKRKRSDSMSE